MYFVDSFQSTYYVLKTLECYEKASDNTLQLQGTQLTWRQCDYRLPRDQMKTVEYIHQGASAWIAHLSDAVK